MHSTLTSISSVINEQTVTIISCWTYLTGWPRIKIFLHPDQWSPIQMYIPLYLCTVKLMLAIFIYFLFSMGDIKALGE